MIFPRRLNHSEDILPRKIVIPQTKNKPPPLNHSEDIKSSISETNFLSKILALVLDTLQKAVSSGVNFTFVVFSYA